MKIIICHEIVYSEKSRSDAKKFLFFGQSETKRSEKN